MVLVSSMNEPLHNGTEEKRSDKEQTADLELHIVFFYLFLISFRLSLISSMNEPPLNELLYKSWGKMK